MLAKRRPKLGQHFLTSERYQRRIVDALPLRSDDLVIEIGPGRGAMTGLLRERVSRVVAVELDSALARHLEARFGGAVEVMAADILQVDIGEVCRRHGVAEAFVFGNLPYYITSPILHHLLECPGPCRAIACVVQAEVADRITARPGSRDYGYLSVLTQACTAPRLVFRIPPSAFTPPPAVISALVSFDMRTEPAVSAGARPAFLEFARRGFAHKRKTLANNLGPEYGAQRIRDTLASLALGQKVRAEELALDNLVQLFETLRLRS